MSDDLDDPVSAGTKHETKQPWEPPRLTYEGSTEELIQHGSGKSSTGGDPGDVLKQTGTG